MTPTDEQVERVARIIESALAAGRYCHAIEYSRADDAAAALRQASRAAIAALQPQDGWQDIASAPKDRPVLLYRPTLRGEYVPKIMSSSGRGTDGLWFNWNYYCSNGVPLPDEHPTHWRPLPKPPAPPAAEIERTKGGG